ncbi:MAG TPA: hypothetical protein VFR85_08310 [Anaeromyxobacteraceae bacterium]|nr:hypothetical protein [Anaeromyxobacteraceae bacterium]
MNQGQVAGRSGAVALAPPAPVEGAGEALGEEQLIYARWLDGGMRAGLLMLLLSAPIYLLGLLRPHVPVDDLPRYWSLPVKKYLAATGIEPGWSWVFMLHRGDFLNFVGIAFLSGVTIACYLAISPIFFRRKDRIYAWLAVAEVLVLGLAASGVLSVGGH